MKTLISPFIGIAAVGLVLSLLVHLSALLRVTNPLGKAAWGLHVGVFVVWLPAVLVAQRLTRNATQKDCWKIALRGCPGWMRYMTIGFFGYAIVNFAIFLLGSVGGRESEPDVFRGFSGHWMAFYSAAMAMLYSFLRVDTRPSRCINGHEVGPLANYCEKCGQQVKQDDTLAG